MENDTNSLTDDLLYRLARVVRNVEGKSPSTTGPEIGQILMELRLLNGRKYDKEVLLIQG